VTGGWRLLETWSASPERAMGLDEALLERPETPPTLRLYTWSPDTLSLGYFQRYSDVPRAAAATRVVRRITGGGAIHHAGELTWSITADAKSPLYRGPIAPSYERVHAVIIEALGACGVEARLRREEHLTSEREATGMCFHASTPLDIVWDGAKGVGSAQRRRGGRVLHHGSIKLEASELEEGVARAPQVTPQRLSGEIVRVFEEHVGTACVHADPTEQEWAEADRRGSRFTAEEWVRRR
jgi:lipoate-protein ligase A